MASACWVAAQRSQARETQDDNVNHLKIQKESCPPNFNRGACSRRHRVGHFDVQKAADTTEIVALSARDAPS